MKPPLPVARHSITKRFVPFALILLAVGILLIRPLPATLAASGFTAGNLVIYRVGSGTGSLVNTGNPVFLDEYTPTGTLVQSIALPTTASGAQKQLIKHSYSNLSDWRWQSRQRERYSYNNRFHFR